jgi:SAM-dependent methyltransferase
MVQEQWAVADAYEAYVGRWSRRVAAEFLRWLDVPAGRRWLDVGCGTGALASVIIAGYAPAELVGVDPSVGFLAQARERIPDARARFQPGDARDLPVPTDHFEAVVSGLALNFVPEPELAAAELRRVAGAGAVVAAYVWDYAEGMQMMRAFWDAAQELDAAMAALDEARFPLCNPVSLAALWTATGFTDVATRAVEIPTVFTNFDDYWQPFLGGQGPAPAYAMSLPQEHRDALRELLRERLPAAPDGSISLNARAWAVRGAAPW